MSSKRLYCWAKVMCMQTYAISPQRIERCVSARVLEADFPPTSGIRADGTDHPIAHLYDVNTFQCYLPANVPEIGVNGSINQVRYSSTGGMYVTASKDGAVRLWDGVTANCVRSIVGAHGTTETISANFTKDQRFCSLLRKGFFREALGSWDWKIGQTISRSHTYAVALSGMFWDSCTVIFKKMYASHLHVCLHSSTLNHVRPSLGVPPAAAPTSLSMTKATSPSSFTRGSRPKRSMRRLGPCPTRRPLAAAVNLSSVAANTGDEEAFGLLLQAVFNDTEEFVLSIDEPSNEIIIWDAITTEKVARWPSNHVGAPRWLEQSPTEAAFVSCGNDRSVRFWKELL
ncbi:transducin/WD40 repeat-like superfamily protein [Actinidia rufa]|uniref:Cleavage stimulation factor 50 kDa subunit n=1 Tax=Actinidia rufa TaxID=165716 RepID=A0A7J0DQV0_9ERIC|nr:transducin/WD40 repeat-like superfamily protein [Actinidia rufa]